MNALAERAAHSPQQLRTLAVMALGGIEGKVKQRGSEPPDISAEIDVITLMVNGLYDCATRRMEGVTVTPGASALDGNHSKEVTG
jgi:hypothetical protein